MPANGVKVWAVNDQAGESSQKIRTRQVFYIPGYDPMLPRRYRELYRKEARAQAEILGYTIDLKGKQGSKNYAWSVHSTINEAKTDTTFEFLLWSDIVSQSMERSIPRTFLLLSRVVWVYVASGALFRLMRLRKGPVIAALYPVFMLTAQLLVAIALTLGVGFGFAQFLPFGGAWLLGVGLGAWLMILFKRFDNKFFAYYLLHDYAFSAQFRGAYTPALIDRMKVFQDRINTALSSDVDEVLVVGHSSGAHIGVSVLADLLRGREAETGAKLAFLTLGQVVPMVSFLPKANQLRQDLHDLCQRDDLTWVDVSAPGDGCTFALCDPVSVSGAAPKLGQKWPLVLSAAFSQTLSREKYKQLKRRYFRLHFQYLCAFDQPQDYDYFQVTAGPVSLRDRFARVAPSPSRITDAASGFSVSPENTPECKA